MLKRRIAALAIGQTMILPVPAGRAPALYLNTVASTASTVRRETGHLFHVRKRDAQVVVSRITERERSTGRHPQPEARRIAALEPGCREIFAWPQGQYSRDFAWRLRSNIRYLTNQYGMRFTTRSLAPGFAIQRIA